jgi:hypothetical protein
MTVRHVAPIGPWLHGPEAGAHVRGLLDAAAPLVAWLRTNVGPSQLNRTR